MVAVPNQEFCTECADLVDTLDPRTGWCPKCTKEYYDATGIRSQAEAFLESNADHIEHYLLQGRSLNESIDMLRSSFRPICASCGAVMKRAAKNSVFCRKTTRCRKAARRYVYLYERKGYTKAQALSVILEELG